MYSVSLAEKKNSGDFFFCFAKKKNQGIKIYLFCCFAVLLFSNAPVLGTCKVRRFDIF